jgi:tripartite-type tricarboxylate transporter receptor subunit TctC
MPYDAIKDFKPICALIAPLMTIAVHPSVPANSITELIAYAKANSGKLGYASSGIGSPHHIAGALLCQLAGINMVHVPYKGGAPAAVDLVGGQVPVGYITLSSALPFHKAGKIRILGMTEKKRTALLPDVPSISETVKGFEVTNWQGLFGPANLPPAIVNALQAECLKGFNSPSIKSQMEAQGLSVIVDTPDHFAAFVRQENQKWGSFVKSLNMVIE